VTTATQRLTFAEYLTYEDSSDTRYELVEGELQPMGVGTGKHAQVILFLYDLLRAEIQQRQQSRAVVPAAIALRTPRGANTARVPDLTVLEQSQWLALEDREAAIDLREPAPRLVVEVTNPSTRREDSGAKHAEYMVRDIPEYWIVDVEAAKVIVFVLVARSYDTFEFAGDDRIQSPTFPDLKLSAAQILAASI